MNSLFKLTIFLIILFVNGGIVRQEWNKEKPGLRTSFSSSVSPGNVHPEYPRPQMVRQPWISLNGLWSYSIVDLNRTLPIKQQAKIMVPFPVESLLSGVKANTTITSDNKIIYSRQFYIPKRWRDGRTIIHFGAVDWETEVYVNGKLAGRNKGGYNSFSFDITSHLLDERRQQISVHVKDPTDASTQPRGKQVRTPAKIWYTSTSGIWQSVWLESVSRTAYVTDFTMTPDIDQSRLLVVVEAYADDRFPHLEVVVEVLDHSGSMHVHKQPLVSVATPSPKSRSASLTVSLPGCKLWSPDSPYLYDIVISIVNNGTKVDEFKSYFGMRKVSLAVDMSGFTRIVLNDKPLFQFGLLDQGFWPDGLYTAPSDAALRYDLEVTKRLGFNMVRKHVKVEPDRWYYWCDKMGLLVWQDMPSGDAETLRYKGPDITKTESGAKQFEFEWRAIMDQLKNHPSIVVWVPFNEGWGQFETERISSMTKAFDPTRLVDSVSGWIDRGVGDIIDVHNYPNPIAPVPEAARASVLGEYGGIGLALPGHSWKPMPSWSYKNIQNTSALTKEFVRLVHQLAALKASHGLSAAIYTQTTDVEGEVNGIMTYDRKVVKLEEQETRAAIYSLIN